MSVSDFNRYIELYRKSVTNAALFIVKEPADAEDIAQDVFLKLYTYTETFNDDAHVKAWLLRCAVNAAINMVKSPKRRALSTEDIAELPDTKQTSYSEVTAAVMRLEPKYRAAVFLHYYEGYTVEETAKLLGVSVAVVKWRLKRARGVLREWLEERS